MRYEGEATGRCAKRRSRWLAGYRRSRGGRGSRERFHVVAVGLTPFSAAPYDPKRTLMASLMRTDREPHQQSELLLPQAPCACAGRAEA